MPYSNTFSDVLGVIYARGLMALRERCVMPRLVNSSFSRDAQAQGDTIQISQTSAISTVEITPNNVAVDPLGTTASKVPLVLDQWHEAPFTLSDKEIAEVQNSSEYRLQNVDQAIKALANKVNVSLFNLYKNVYGWTGTPSTTPFATDTSAATAARTVLNKQLAPLDDRSIVLNPDAEGNALGLRAFQDTSYRGDTGGIISGQIGYKLGFNFAMDQAVPSHTCGVLGTPLINNPPDGYSAGDTTIAIDGFTSTAIPRIGDVFTIAGSDQTYAVTGVTGASAAVTVTISPPLDQDIADGDAVTFKDSHVVNLAFHREAFGFASRLLAGDGGLTGDESANVMQMADPVSGLALRLERRREYYRTRYAFSLLWGCTLVRPEYACRIAG